MTPAGTRLFGEDLVGGFFKVFFVLGNSEEEEVVRPPLGYSTANRSRERECALACTLSYSRRAISRDERCMSAINTYIYIYIFLQWPWQSLFVLR